MSAYKIISAVIRERVDDSPSDRYLVVAPEDRIVWVATDEPQDLSPEGRKKAVHQAGLFSLLNKIKREENAVESDSYDSRRDPAVDAKSSGISYSLDLSLSEEDYMDEDPEVDDIEFTDTWEKEKH